MPELEASPVLTVELPNPPVAPPRMPPPQDPRIGQQLGKYRIRRRLGQGGMGVVYEAEDTLLKRTVALKFLPHAVSADPRTWQRFLLEAQAAARLNHPNTIAIYEIDQREGTSFLAMEYVDGGSTHDYLKIHGAFPWPQATQILAEVCRGLSAAHQAGLIHRDIKPANIMRGRDGSVKLADFGLAKATDSSVSSITGSHSAVGTPSFMSPEQCQCEPVDHRSDIYSLGATYYALLVGQTPFGNGGPLEVMFAHCSKPAPDPREVFPKIPEACAVIVQKAMAKAPVERYQSADEILAALEAVLALPEAAAVPPLPSKRPSTVVPLDTLSVPGGQKSDPTEAMVSQIPRWRKLLLAFAGVLFGVAIGVMTFFQPGVQVESSSPKQPPAAAAKPGREPEPPPTVEPRPPKAEPPPPRPAFDKKPFPPRKPPREPAAHAPRKPRLLLVVPPQNLAFGEYTPVRRILEDLGADISIASTTIHTIKPEGFNAGRSVVPDLALDQVQPREYDALILVGGKNVSEYVGESAGARRLRWIIQTMHRDNKLIGSFGLATGLLGKAGVINGVEVTAPAFLHPKLREEGGTIVQQPVVVSRRIVTAREPLAAPQFAKTIAMELGLRP